jgi:hypothetical protein
MSTIFWQRLVEPTFDDVDVLGSREEHCPLSEAFLRSEIGSRFSLPRLGQLAPAIFAINVLGDWKALKAIEEIIVPIILE